MELRIIKLALVCLLALPGEAGAWGSGHDDVVREILERISPDLRATFTPEIEKEAIQHSSHYPDSFEPFLAGEVGEDALVRLSAAGMKVRYDLHSERGMAATFIELVEALRAKDAARSAHWIATLSHVIADMAACNHDPIVHTATYGWADWNLTLPGGGGFSSLRPLLDLAATARDHEGGGEVFDRVIEGILLEDDQRDATKALVEVMLYGQEGAAYCSRRGVGILEGAVGWIDRKDVAARDTLWLNMSELGAWAVVRTLRDLEVASRFARNGTSVTLTPEIESAYEEGVERIQRERPLEDEALFAPILHELAPDQQAAIGVVVEPSWAMNGAMFGFASRVLSVAIARTLKDAGRSYATLDVRAILAEGFPVPERLPQVVIVASSFASYHALKSGVFDDRLADYLKRGGRVLWITGNSPPAPKSLAPLHRVMKRADAKSRLPVPDESFVGASLDVTGVEPPLRVAHSPITAAGWQQPFCPWFYEPGGAVDLEPFVTIKAGDQSRVVGVISRDRKILTLPVYAMTPHLLEGGGAITVPHEPALDPASGRVLFASLGALTGGTGTVQLAPHPVNNPESPLMLAVPGFPDDTHAIDFEKLPRWPAEHVIVSDVRGSGGVNQHNYLAFHAGRFWLMWSDGPGVEDRVGQRVKFATSADGLQWDEPRFLTPQPPDSGPTSPHYNTRSEKGLRYIARGFWKREGELLALAALDEAAGFFGRGLALHAFRLGAEGESWEDLGVIADDAINNFPPERLASGEWMMSRRPHNYKTAGVDFLVGGITALNDWKTYPVLGTSSELKAEEPLWWTLPDGNLVALFRDNGGSKYLYRSFSTDQGRTWTEPVRTNFPDATSKLHGQRLRDGRYLLVSNANPKKRDPLTLAISDDGLVFDRLARLVGGRHVDYPHLIQHEEYLLIAFAGQKQTVEILKIKIADLNRLSP